MLQVCQRAGLVKFGVVALDGTKVRAQASKHKAMSDGRMQTEIASCSLMMKQQPMDDLRQAIPVS